MSLETRSTFASTVGGVMTEEAGAITGDLEARTLPEAGLLNVSVRYAGAEDWYTVAGSPVPLSGEEKDTAKLHERVVIPPTSPGPVANGNEQAVSLRGLDRI